MDSELSPMWFFDEVPEEYRQFQKDTRAYAREYLELRVLLQAARGNLAATPEDEYCQAKVRYLTKRLRGLEQKALWLADDQLKEYQLWGVPH